PEFVKDQRFALHSEKAVTEFAEAKKLGIITKPVLLGPITYLLLGKEKETGFHRLDLIDRLVPVYEELLAKLGAAGAEWVQIDEPYLALDLDARTLELYKSVYNRLSTASGDTKLILTTYFEALRENAETALNLPVDAVHIDLVRGEDQLTDLLPLVNDQMILSLGVVDGRNIWKNDYDKSLSKISDAVSVLGTDRVWVAPSCSLLHVPFDLALEDNEA